MRRTALLAMVMLILTGAGAGMETHDVTIESGESFELDRFIFEYDQQTSGDSQVFKIGEEAGDSVWLLYRSEGDEIYDLVNRTINVSDDLEARVTELGRDDEGLYIDIDLTGPADVFSSAMMEGSSPDRVITSQGSSVDVPLTIENTGMTNQTFQLGANTSLDVTYGYQDFNVSEILVKAGEEVAVDATVHVPEEARTGDHEVALEATNTSDLSYSFVTEVRGQVQEPEMRFEVSEQYAGMTPGDETNIRVSVRNMAQPTLRNVEFDVTVPDGWEYEIRPEGHSELEQYDMGRSTLVVDAPADVQPGDHFVEVSASSDRTSAEAERVRINISEPSEMGDVGLVLMGASFLLLVIVFLTFRRR